MSMRPSPSVFVGRIRPLAALVAVWGVLACDGATGPGRIRSLALVVPSSELRPGDLMRVSAKALDASGDTVGGVVVRWRSLTPGTLDVSTDGLMLAKRPGEGIARATVGTVHADLRLDLVNPPIAELRIDLDTLRLLTPGGGTQVLARAFDHAGIGIIGATFEWESAASRFAAVSPAGVVTPLAVGRSVVTVRAEGFADQVVVDVQPLTGPSAPIISSVTPSTVTPGQSVVVTGLGFAGAAAGNSVLIDGTPVVVSAASNTQLTLSLPPATSFACQPSRTVTLQVGTSGGLGVAPVALNTGTPVALSVGQSLALTTASDARCLLLSPAAGRYLVTVPHAARAYGSGPASLTLRGDAVGTGGATIDGAAVAAERNAVAIREAAVRREGARGRVDAREWLAGRRARAQARAHGRLLEANAEAARGRPASSAPALLRAPAANGAALTAPTLGSIVPLRIPAIGQANVCSEYTAIGARVVHVGEHVALLEDTATVAEYGATVAGQMDLDYQAIGAELEARGWPIVQAFGNPLVMDSRLDDNGRVMIVFTPRLNARLGGAVLAGVVTCDFFPRAQFAASNVGEYLYAQVPQSLADGMEAGSRTLWRHEMRATLVHELKHVTSYAERIVRGQPLEEQWLEEATARHAEELWFRAAYGAVRFSNADFSASLACELRANDPAYPACADAPRAMRPHLEALWTFLDAPTARSPLGGDAGDFSYYGSAWALTRWLADLEAPSEPVFFTALTVNRQSGVANLEARTGRGWDELLVEWSLAMVSDDLSGFVAQSPRLRFPSFDLRSIYQGLCDVAGSCVVPVPSPFARPWPVQPLALQGGSFAADLVGIEPGGFAVIELALDAAVAAQALELRGYRGAPLPPGVRLGIVRVQ
jgi:hypothetical protein